MTSERKFIEENVKRVLLKEYLKRKTERSGFGGLDIQRTPMGTRVTLIAERPGMVIGRKGESIKELTEYVENEFKFDNPQIEVKEVPNPNLNPHIMAQKLATALERGWHFRRAGHSTVRRIMSAGAKGCQVIISGKLTGQRHRTEKFREGHIKYCGESKLDWMREGYAVAKKKLGVIGVKVQIMDPNAKLPDEIELRELSEVVEIKTEVGEPISEVGEEGVAAETEAELEPVGEGEVAATEMPEAAATESELIEPESSATEAPATEIPATEAPAETKPKRSKKEAEESEEEIVEDESAKEKEKPVKKGRPSKKSLKKEKEADAEIADELEKEEEKKGEEEKIIEEPKPEAEIAEAENKYEGTEPPAVPATPEVDQTTPEPETKTEDTTPEEVAGDMAEKVAEEVAEEVVEEKDKSKKEEKGEKKEEEQEEEKESVETEKEVENKD